MLKTNPDVSLQTDSRARRGARSRLSGFRKQELGGVEGVRKASGVGGADGEVYQSSQDMGQGGKSLIGLAFFWTRKGREGGIGEPWAGFFFLNKSGRSKKRQGNMGEMLLGER